MLLVLFICQTHLRVKVTTLLFGSGMAFSLLAAFGDFYLLFGVRVGHGILSLLAFGDVYLCFGFERHRNSRGGGWWSESLGSDSDQPPVRVGHGILTTRF